MDDQCFLDDEQARVQALHRYEILDTEREAIFDDVTRLLAYVTKTPVSLISFVDVDRQWFKSEFGLGVRETERDVSFCSYAIRQSGIYIVPDTLKDPLFISNRLVLAAPSIRFYAASPIITPDGYAIGTVNVIDMRPRELSQEQKDLLRFMSRQVMSVLELRYALKRTQKAEEFASGIVRSTQDCIQVLDLGGRVLFISDSGIKLRELARAEDVLDKEWLDFWIPRDRALVGAAIDTAKQGGVGRFQAAAPTPGGNQKWWDEIITPIRQDGQTVSLLSVSRDITASKQLEDELGRAKEEAEEASQAKDNFLAALSHELRTPLTPVLAAVTLMERSSRGTNEHRAEIDVIRRNIALEARLIDDLLDLTRIVRGKVTLERTTVDISEILQRVIEICRADLSGQALEFHADVSHGPCLVHGDSSRLHQALWNLLKNAIKFTPPDGKISVLVYRHGEHVAVDISDTGIGIEAQDLARIFNAFEQGKQSTTRQFGGLGLGLAITKSLIGMHGGRIEAVSEGRARGATFKVRLPAESESSLTRTLTAEAQQHCPIKILLVEDHPDTARMMSRLLESCGHKVELAGNVSGALHAARTWDFDLLISDLGLPDGSGLEIMSELRREGTTLQGIALSGFGQEEDVRRSKEAGFTEHITKPVDFDVLAQVVEQVSRHEQSPKGPNCTPRF